MANPNIGNLVSTAWIDALNAEPFIAKIVTKDGRWFATWLRYSSLRLEQWVHYRSGINRRATFEPQTIDGEIVWRQREGRGQPRMAWVPESWVPLADATPERMEQLRPPKDIFGSRSLMSLLK